MPKKRKTTSSPKKETKSRELEKKLIENMVALQKIQTGMTEKFDKLANQIADLLALFEVTAKNFAKTLPKGEYEKDKEFLEKVDKLLDQNKLIAKGLALMEDRLKERVYGPPQEKQPPSIQITRPLPRF